MQNRGITLIDHELHLYICPIHALHMHSVYRIRMFQINSSSLSNYVRLCGSRKNPYPPHGRSLEIPRGRWGGGVLKATFLEEMYDNKLEFPGGRRCAKQKPFSGREEYRYFLELRTEDLGGIDFIQV